jgi:hypothetical protein
MTFPANPAERSPKGDHNRRLALAIDPEVFAAEAGVTVEELREYEETGPDGRFDVLVAERVGKALELMETLKEPRVTNGPTPTTRVVTLPPTSIQRDVDSGGWFGRSGRGERRGLVRSLASSVAPDPVAG